MTQVSLQVFREEPQFFSLPPPEPTTVHHHHCSSKRKRSSTTCSCEDKELGENFEHVEAASDCHASKPKRMRIRISCEAKKSAADFLTCIPNPNVFNSTFRITREALCNVSLTLTNGLLGGAQGPTPCFDQLRVTDFCSRELLTGFKDSESGEFRVPEFELSGRDAPSNTLLTYLRGMMVRKSEVAVVPVLSSTSLLLVFEKDTLKASFVGTSRTSVSGDGATGDGASSMDSFYQEEKNVEQQCTQQQQKQQQQVQQQEEEEQEDVQLVLSDCKLHAILIPRYTICFDLDETLVRTRFPKDENDVPGNNEIQFTVLNTRLITTVRTGTERVLRWACKMFNVHIFTNAMFEYAKEICKILDPTRSTLLANVNEESEEDWRHLIKSRADFKQAEHLPSTLGVKDLCQFSIDTFATVVLDDDITVWANKCNVLPFLHVVGNIKTPFDFLSKMRNETWIKLVQLQQSKAQLSEQVKLDHYL